MKPLDFIADELAELDDGGLRRRLRPIEWADGMRAVVDGRECVVFCSNDYLGLARDERIKEAAAEAACEYGAGGGASRLVCGDLAVHRRLEERLASFKGTAASLVFASGFQTNLGLIAALAGPTDAVLCDRLNHASIVDGCRLSGAKLLVYEHVNLIDLERCLRLAENHRRRLIVTDSLFSMDGDCAPLPEICRLAGRYRAMVAADEAHATGVYGAGGRGLAHHLGVKDLIDVQMGTLSKALGSQGGFVAGSAELIDHLLNRARSFVFSTALNPAACAAAGRAIELLESGEAGVEQLWRNVRRLRAGLAGLGLAVAAEGSPIIPLVVGGAEETVELSERLMAAGYFVAAIRPPTVPKGTSRLRLSVSAAHTAPDIDGLLKELSAFINILGSGR